MRLALFAVIVFLNGSSLPAQTAKERIQHVREMVAQQKKDLDDARSKLTWTHGALVTAQSEVDKVGKERDKWQQYGMSEHDARMAEKVKLLRCYLIIGVMVVIFGVYAFLKFYLHLPI